MKYFIDTSFWCALYDANDEHHHKAAVLWKTLSNLPLSLYTSDFVFDETITLINRKIDHDSAVALGQTLLNSKAVSMLQIDKTLFIESWNLFQEYSDKGFSFTDCTSCILMKIYKIELVLAFDHHFTQIKFTVNQIVHAQNNT